MIIDLSQIHATPQVEPDDELYENSNSAGDSDSDSDEDTGIVLSLTLPAAAAGDNQKDDLDLAKLLGGGKGLEITVIGAVISEGLSRPYEAALQLLSTKVFTAAEEDKILDCPCRLCISQSSNARYLSGIIGAISYEKQAYSGDTPYYLYNLEIICPLDALKFTGELKTYLKKLSEESSGEDSVDYENLTVIDAVRALFQRCGIAKITCPLENQTSPNQNQNSGQQNGVKTPALSDYGTDKLIAQGDVCDYEYLQRLLVLNGLNYNFIHKENSFYPEAYLTPMGDFDDEKSREVTVSSSSGAIVFSNFSLRRQSSKQASQLDPGYRELYSYLDNLGDDAEDIDVAKFYLENLKNALNNRATEGRATGSDVRLLCGNGIAIGDFYPSDDALSLKIENIKTVCSAPPSDLALPGIPGDNQIEQEISLISCADTGTPGSRAVCRGLGLIGYFESLKARPAGFGMQKSDSAPGFAPGQGLRTLEAVVCDEKGSTDPDKADSYDASAPGPVPSVFYALPSGSGEIIKVKALSLLNGNGNGLFALPRVGEKILVLSSGSQYYLMGFLRAPGPYGADDFVYGSASHDAALSELREPGALNSSRWSFTDLSDTASDHVNSYSIGFESLGDQASYFKACAIDKSLSLLIGKLAAENNSKQYRTVYDEADTTDTGNSDKAKIAISTRTTNFTEALSNYESAQNAYAEDQTDSNLKQTASAVEDLTAANKALDNAVKDLVDNINAVTHTIKQKEDDYDKDKVDENIKQTYATPRLKLYASEGNVEVIAPSGRFDVRAASSTANVSGTLVLKGKKVVINADDSLKLSVGGNSISMDHSKITIKSQKWTEVNGILDARLLMDGLSGISMNGMNVTGTGFMGASLSDAFGGKVASSLGGIKLSGLDVSMATTGKIDSIKNLAKLLKAICQETGALVTAAKGTTSSRANAICYAVDDTANLIAKAATYRQKVKSGQCDTLTEVLGFLELLSSMASLLINTMYKVDANYWDEYVNEAKTVTRIDAAKMGLLIYNLNTVAAFFPAVIATLRSQASSVTIKPGIIKVAAQNKEEKTVQTKLSNTPVIGL